MVMKNILTVFNEYKDENGKGVTIIRSRDREDFISYSQILDTAAKYLVYFQNEGLRKGDELLYQVEDIDDFIYTFWACQLGGITAVPVDIGENNENHLTVFRIWNVLNHPYYLSSVKNFGAIKRVGGDNNPTAINEMSEHFIDLHKAKKNEETQYINFDYETKEFTSLIIFSSGSTGTPKGIPITYTSLYRHVNALASREKVTQNDITINWAPLSHNLGLISVHLVSTLVGINQFLMAKQLFIKDPLIWMDKASEHKATMIYAPNFGYKYILSNITGDERWDLSNIRIAFNGAEPINYDLCELFLTTMSKYGLKNNVMYPAYGCSEATSVITLPDVGQKLHFYKLDRKTVNIGDKVCLAEDNGDSISMVSVGYPVDECEIRVCNNQNKVLEDFYVGNLQVRGTNVINSYYNNDEATKISFLEGGWFNTGDLCFTDKGNAIIAGRSKEIIFIYGHNYYPYDIERIAEKCDTYLEGRIVACGVTDSRIQTDQLLIFIEIDIKNNQLKFNDLAAKVKKIISSELGLYVSQVIPVMQLEKTESGKLQRLKMGENYLNGKYNEEIALANEEPFDAQDNIEAIVLAIWKEVFSNESIGLDDNFFDLGGSSNLLIVLTTEIEKRYKDCITAIDLFEEPTVRGLTRVIKSKLTDNTRTQLLLAQHFPGSYINDAQALYLSNQYSRISIEIKEYKNLLSLDNLGENLLSIYLKTIGDLINTNNFAFNYLLDQEHMGSFIIEMNKYSELEDLAQDIREEICKKKDAFAAGDILSDAKSEIDLLFLYTFEYPLPEKVQSYFDIIMFFDANWTTLEIKVGPRVNRKAYNNVIDNFIQGIEIVNEQIN